MADFLIYNTEHWMSKLSQEQIDEYTKKDPDFPRQYAARIMKGDIIEAQPDGFYTGDKARKFRTDVFAAVACPWIKLEDAKKYTEKVYEDAYALVFDEKTMTHSAVPIKKLSRKRRWNIENVVDTKLILKSSDELTLVDKLG